MVSQIVSSTENNFTKGLITEFTGLNFPENAATDTDNCVYTLVGDVTRREGIDFEDNFKLNQVTPQSFNSYIWNNAGGDGQTQMTVVFSGSTIYFYQSSAVTSTRPISRTLIGSTINVPTFTASGNTFDVTKECQFADGNGYLFVYHPSCDPFFCALNNGIVTASVITVKIRDFVGAKEVGVPVNLRPNSLTQEHLYNLTNQGWTQGAPWVMQSIGSGAPTVVSSGTVAFSVPSGVSGVALGQQIVASTVSNTFPGGNFIPGGTAVMSGTVTGYSGGVLTMNVTGSLNAAVGNGVGPYQISPYNQGYINTWQAAEGNFPSNADVWWYFKDNNNVFNPAVTGNQVTLNAGAAPSGHFTLNAFQITRTLASGVAGITDVITNVRPRTGTWFQGRVWYAGVDASQDAGGDADFYTWTENLYFSQIVQTPDDFGNCYQTNDPTSETLFDLLPTDGGVVKIQGAGAIYKLFPIQNGMLVFASNGIWFITGSQGIGFAANDYTVTKISSVKAISSTSFVDVQGLPYFWNEEGIYSVTPSQNGSLSVEPLTVGTILTFYNEIPLSSKQYVRGAYHPIDYIIQWTYRSTSDEGNLTLRYQFDKVLNYNTYNKAFFPYTLMTGPNMPDVCGIFYASSPMVDAPDPVFKYMTVTAPTGMNFTFSEENNEDFVDWESFNGTGFNFDSYFVTGYKLHGQGQKKFQLPYIYVYSKAEEPTAYVIQSIWDYANDRRSGKYSSAQTIYNNKPYFGMIPRRHRLRGRGLVLQIKITSVDGEPFDIMGWSTYENLNQGI